MSTNRREYMANLMQNRRQDPTIKAKEKEQKKAYNAKRYIKEKAASDKRMQRLRKRFGCFTDLTVKNITEIS